METIERIPEKIAGLVKRSPVKYMEAFFEMRCRDQNQHLTDKEVWILLEEKLHAYYGFNRYSSVQDFYRARIRYRKKNSK